MLAGKVEGSRDRNRPLKVFVSERERAEIETRAAATGLSVSAYFRNLGLGFQPHSTLDQGVILALLKVNADQGRLGGLFKLWLSGQSAPSPDTTDIRKPLAAIEDCQLNLKALIGQLSDGN
jgi:Mobilization protein NikA